jgi:xanthine dehydrogenase accessory factor
MDAALLADLNAERRARRAVVLVTDLGRGAGRLVRPGDDLAADPFGEEIGKRLRSGQSGLVTLPDGVSAFLTVHLPPPRLVVCGAVHISQALAPMAKIAGLDVTIVDPRTAFASPERFPDVRLLAAWPQDVMADLGFDPWTGLAALTHDPKIDDPAIAAALSAGCFYVGALGSRKTHAKRVERLLAAGVDEAALGRIHAPIGLSIGAASPAEIAVAVLAEAIAALRRPAGAARSAAA